MAVYDYTNENGELRYQVVRYDPKEFSQRAVQMEWAVSSGTWTVMGSYESWMAVIGGILAHVGVKGFLANAGELLEQSETDSEAEQAVRFLSPLHDVLGNRRFTSPRYTRFAMEKPPLSAFARLWRLCFMRHSRHYATSRTMLPRLTGNGFGPSQAVFWSAVWSLSRGIVREVLVIAS